MTDRQIADVNARIEYDDDTPESIIQEDVRSMLTAGELRPEINIVEPVTLHLTDPDTGDDQVVTDVLSWEDDPEARVVTTIEADGGLSIYVNWQVERVE